MTAALSLALGVGTNAVFSVINAEGLYHCALRWDS